MNMIKDRSMSYILTVVVGILMLIEPRHIGRIVFIVVGALVAVNGLASVLVGGKVTRYDRDGVGILSNGVINLAVGLVLIFLNNRIMTIGSYVFGAYLIVDGIIGAADQSSDSLTKILHLLLAFAGLMLVLHPFTLWFSLLRWCGIAMIADGAVGLATGSDLIRR